MSDTTYGQRIDTAELNRIADRLEPHLTEMFMRRHIDEQLEAIDAVRALIGAPRTHGERCTIATLTTLRDKLTDGQRP